MTCNRNSALLLRVLVLPMTTLLLNFVPTICLNDSDDVPYFHRYPSIYLFTRTHYKAEKETMLLLQPNDSAHGTKGARPRAPLGSVESLVRQFLANLFRCPERRFHELLCQHRAGQEFGACGTRTQSLDVQMPLGRKDSLCDWLAGRIQLIDQHPGERSLHNASDLPISGHGDGNGFGVVVAERGLDE